MFNVSSSGRKTNETYHQVINGCGDHDHEENRLEYRVVPNLTRNES